MLFATWFAGFELFGPDFIVHVFTDEIETDSENANEQHETNALW